MQYAHMYVCVPYIIHAPTLLPTILNKCIQHKFKSSIKLMLEQKLTIVSYVNFKQAVGQGNDDPTEDASLLEEKSSKVNVKVG